VQSSCSSPEAIAKPPPALEDGLEAEVCRRRHPPCRGHRASLNARPSRVEPGSPPARGAAWSGPEAALRLGVVAEFRVQPPAGGLIGRHRAQRQVERAGARTEGRKLIPGGSPPADLHRRWCRIPFTRKPPGISSVRAGPARRHRHSQLVSGGHSPRSSQLKGGRAPQIRGGRKAASGQLTKPPTCSPPRPPATQPLGPHPAGRPCCLPPDGVV